MQELTRPIYLIVAAFPIVLFKVYCMDHTYTTIRVPVAASVKEVLSAVADKLGSGEGLIIIKMSSGGGNSLLQSRISHPNRTLPEVSKALPS